MLVNILSTKPILQDFAGTKDPIWARNVIIPIYSIIRVLERNTKNKITDFK